MTKINKPSRKNYGSNEWGCGQKQQHAGNPHLQIVTLSFHTRRVRLPINIQPTVRILKEQNGVAGIWQETDILAALRPAEPESVG